MISSVIKVLFHRLILLSITISSVQAVYAEEELWQFNHTLETNLQTYNGAADRKDSHSAGYYISADYLDTGNLAFSYNNTSVNLGNNSYITENLYFLSGEYHQYPDSLPGKLSLRFDSYFGKDTLEYSISAPPPTTPGPGQGPGYGKINNHRAASDTVKESIDINTYYFQCAFINYKKTFYTDIGYAFTEYSATSNTVVKQITPSVGFGWNDSYDWIQLRVYFIELQKDTSAFNEDKFESLETKYTHWLPDKASSKLEFIRFTLLSGKRVLAVDPDTTTIYSITDLHKTSFSSSLQWKTTKNRKIQAAIQYDQYHNSILADNYDSYLFYINLQFRN